MVSSKFLYKADPCFIKSAKKPSVAVPVLERDLLRQCITKLVLIKVGSDDMAGEKGFARDGLDEKLTSYLNSLQGRLHKDMSSENLDKALFSETQNSPIISKKNNEQKSVTTFNDLTKGFDQKEVVKIKKELKNLVMDNISAISKNASVKRSFFGKIKDLFRTKTKVKTTAGLADALKNKLQKSAPKAFVNAGLSKSAQQKGHSL